MVGFKIHSPRWYLTPWRGQEPDHYYVWAGFFVVVVDTASSPITSQRLSNYKCLIDSFGLLLITSSLNLY